MNRKTFIVVAIFLLCLSACTTYYIPLDSFKQQFADINEKPMREVTVEGPLGGYTKYKTYPIDYIKCLDKHGKPFELRNSPSIEIRFTHGPNHKKTVYYFDRLYVTDTSVAGSESRIMPFIKKTISLNEITKIEVQDGHKRYRYVQ